MADTVDGRSASSVLGLSSVPLLAPEIEDQFSVITKICA